MTDLTVAMAAVEKTKVAQQEVMTKTQTASPMVKAALEQVKAALVVLPDNAEIKASVDGLAAASDRQDKSIVAMTEAIAAMDKQMVDTKVEIDAAAKLIADSKAAIVATEESMKALTVEAAPIEAQATAAGTELATAEQAVLAAATVVESRRQQLRPQLQLSQAN